MNRRNWSLGKWCVTLGLIGLMAGADAPKEAKPGDAPEIKLPPGWTQADLDACIAAGTPGENHKHLAKDAGVWVGRSRMWMFPGAEPVESECQCTVTPVMDGRYIRAEMKGDMPGLGPFTGFGLYGFDNVSQKFVSTWIDNHSTGMMQGEGKLSDDGKTLTWTYTCNCPLTKKPTVMRDVETYTGPDTKRLESYMTDPKSGVVFKMLSIEFARKK
jgi:hypothetical protein